MDCWDVSYLQPESCRCNSIGRFGVKKAIQKLYNLSDLPTHEYMLEVSSKGKPYRSIATWYLWKSLSRFDSIG